MELFLNRAPSFPDLHTIPHKIIDNSDIKQRREESRVKQIEKVNKGLRRPDVFEMGNTVYLRDQEGKWNVPAKVVNQRKHQGFDTPSYLLRNLKTGTRNERDIRKFAGDADTTTESTTEAHDNVNSILTGIMK